MKYDCPMIEAAQIESIATKAAKARLPKKTVERVLSEAVSDSEGRDALKLTIVISPDSLPKLEGDALLDTLVQIQNDLQEAGEDRFAIVEYATQDELDDDAGPKP